MHIYLQLCEYQYNAMAREEMRAGAYRETQKGDETEGGEY